jgi:hypothetical protein
METSVPRRFRFVAKILIELKGSYWLRQINKKAKCRPDICVLRRLTFWTMAFQLPLSACRDSGLKRRETLLQFYQFVVWQVPGAAGRHAPRSLEKFRAQVGMFCGACDVVEGAH